MHTPPSSVASSVSTVPIYWDGSVICTSIHSEARPPSPATPPPLSPEPEPKPTIFFEPIYVARPPKRPQQPVPSALTALPQPAPHLRPPPPHALTFSAACLRAMNTSPPAATIAFGDIPMAVPPSEDYLLPEKEKNPEGYAQPSSLPANEDVQNMSTLLYQHPAYHYLRSDRPVCTTGNCTATWQQVIFCDEFIYAHTRQALYPRRLPYELARPLADPRFAYQPPSLTPDKARILWKSLPVITIPHDDKVQVIWEPMYEGVYACLDVDFACLPCGYICFGALALYGPSISDPISYRIEACLEDDSFNALWLLEPYLDSTGAAVNGQTTLEYPTIIVSGSSRYNTIPPRYRPDRCNLQELYAHCEQVRQAITYYYPACNNQDPVGA